MAEVNNSKEIGFKYLQSTLTVGLGMYFHLNKISVIELKYSKLPGLQPNSASVIFTFSVLCILGIVRPFWPSALRRPPRLLRLILEVAFSLFFTDLVLRKVWIPLLMVVASMCAFLSQYMVIVNRDLLYSTLPSLSIWFREEFFYLVRMLMALTSLYLMFVLTGLLEIVTKFIKAFMGEDLEASTGGRAVRRMESTARYMNRHLLNNEEIPSQAPKRKKRRPRSRTRRHTKKIYFDNQPEDVYC